MNDIVAGFDVECKGGEMKHNHGRNIMRQGKQARYRGKHKREQTRSKESEQEKLRCDVTIAYGQESGVKA